jgi:pyruvate-formate lyase
MSIWKKILDYFDLNKRAEAGEKEQQERLNGKEKKNEPQRYVLIQWVDYSEDLEALIKKAEEMDRTTDKHLEIWELGEVPGTDMSWLDKMVWE